LLKKTKNNILYFPRTPGFPAVLMVAQLIEPALKRVHPPGWLGSSKMTQQCFCWRAIIPKLCRSRDLTDEKNREFYFPVKHRPFENLYREQRSSRVLLFFPMPRVGLMSLPPFSGGEIKFVILTDGNQILFISCFPFNIS